MKPAPSASGRRQLRAGRPARGVSPSADSRVLVGSFVLSRPGVAYVWHLAAKKDRSCTAYGSRSWLLQC